MTEGIPVVRMYTDSSGHTRFAKMQIPIEPKTTRANNPIHTKLFCKSDHKTDEKKILRIIKTPPIVGVPAFLII